MSSMDPMKDDFWTQLGTRQRTLLRPYHFKAMVNQKSSLLTKRTAQPTMYNSSYGRILRHFITTADSSSPVTTKTESLDPLHSRCAVVEFSTPAKSKPKLASSFFGRGINKSWIQRILTMIRKSLQS